MSDLLSVGLTSALPVFDPDPAAPSGGPVRMSFHPGIAFWVSRWASRSVSTGASTVAVSYTVSR